MEASSNPLPEQEKRTEPKRKGCSCLSWVLLVGILAILYAVSLPPVRTNLKPTQHLVLMQQARQIGQVLFAYATDNTTDGNAYPDGKSSTEVFQKLVDAGYITDPALVYFPMPGKVQPIPGHKLRPENVSFDVTGGVVPSDPDLLPLVVTTGYRVTYAPGAAVVPILKPYPEYFVVGRPHWYFFPATEKVSPGVAVFYKGNNVVWYNASSGGLSRFISPSFDAKGKTFRQLTPDGVLPPS